MKYVGDFAAAKTVVVNFNTHKADGTPVTLAGTPAVSVYKNSTTESTSGVTLTVDYDSRTGLQHVAIDTSSDGTFYAAGNDFEVVITAGTVDSISVVGVVVATFSLANRSALRPATDGRTLVVDAAGLADANAVKVGPSGSGATQTAGDLAALINAVDDYVDTEVAAIKAKTDNLPSDPADASDVAASFATVNSTLATIASYIDTEVAAIKAKTDNLPSDPADASDVAAAFATVNATLATIAGYVDTEVGAIKARTDLIPDDPADASDVAAAFATVNAALATLAGYVDTEVAAIKAKTDNLPADPAGLAGLASAHGGGSWATATGFAVAGDAMALTVGSGNALVAAVSAVIIADHGSGSYLRNTEPPTPPTAAAISAQVASDLAAAHGAGSWLTATGFSTLDAAGVRAAVGMAAADLDGQLDAIAASIGGGGAPTVEQIRQEIDANSTQLAAILGRLNSAGTTILTGGTVPDDAGRATLVRGDGYYLADGTQFGPLLSSRGLDLSAGVTLRVYNGPTTAGTPLYTTPWVVTGTIGDWVMTADIAEDETAVMTNAEHGWEAVTVVAGRTHTIAQGVFEMAD